MQQNISNPEQRFCYKCHFPANITDAQCTRCGCKALRTTKTIRMLGAVLVFLGGFIAAIMTAVLVFTLGVLSKADAAKLREDEATMWLALGIMGLTLTVGVCFAIAGVLQMIFGKRNTIAVWISLVLVGVLMFAGWIFTSFN